MINNLIDPKIKELVEKKGQKLAFLISEFKIDEETRQAFLDILPSLSLEQKDKLIDILEIKYLDAATRSEDKKFEEELSKIKSDHIKKQEDIDKESIKQLEELEKLLDKK